MGTGCHPGGQFPAFVFCGAFRGAPFFVLDVQSCKMPSSLSCWMGRSGQSLLATGLAGLGWSLNKVRKISMLIFACCVLPVIFVQYFDMWTIVAVLGLAGGAHQAWSASVYTLGSDMFPKSDVASITGLSGMAGQIGSVLFQTAVGFTLSHFVALGNPSHGYDIIFVVCGCAYLAAFIIFSLIVPKINMVESRES